MIAVGGRWFLYGYNLNYLIDLPERALCGGSQAVFSRDGGGHRSQVFPGRLLEDAKVE